VHHFIILIFLLDAADQIKALKIPGLFDRIIKIFGQLINLLFADIIAHEHFSHFFLFFFIFQLFLRRSSLLELCALARFD
jgi:hypothetical protein